MTYKTILVHMKMAHSNQGLLRVAKDIAGRFDARVIGIAACQPTPIFYGDALTSSAVVEVDRKVMDDEIATAEAEFRACFHQSGADIHWRSSTIFEPVANFVARESRCADLVLTSGVSFDPADTARPEKPGDLVMQAGRPVLVVPRNLEHFALNHVVAAWKETREARRALHDAIPLLKLAGKVTVLRIAPDRERRSSMATLVDVTTWLQRHDIVAEPLFMPSTTGDDAYQLNACLQTLQTDLVVAGAYGHSRLREWALGGVTRDLTLSARYCALLAH